MPNVNRTIIFSRRFYVQRRLEQAGDRTKAVYRYGLGFMCVGVVLNWLGFYETALHPVRYLGLAFVASGILLICTAVCKALGRNLNDNSEGQDHRNEDSPGNSNGSSSLPKPPDYNTVINFDFDAPPPSYDAAIKMAPPCYTPTCSSAQDCPMCAIREAGSSQYMRDNATASSSAIAGSSESSGDDHTAISMSDNHIPGIPDSPVPGTSGVPTPSASDTNITSASEMNIPESRITSPPDPGAEDTQSITDNASLAGSSSGTCAITIDTPADEAATSDIPLDCSSTVPTALEVSSNNIDQPCTAPEASSIVIEDDEDHDACVKALVTQCTTNVLKEDVISEKVSKDDK